MRFDFLKKRRRDENPSAKATFIYHDFSDRLFALRCAADYTTIIVKSRTLYLSRKVQNMSQLFRVLYDFDAEEEGEMTVSAGDIVKVIPQVMMQI